MELNFEWKDEYTTGIIHIDRQHRQWFEYTNTLASAIHNGRESDVVPNILLSLLHYTRFHFNFEEELLEKFQYKEEDLHKEQHDLLTKKLMEFINDYGERGVIEIEQFVDFLRHWFVSHIVNSDQQFAKELIEKGANEIEIFNFKSSSNQPDLDSKLKWSH